MQNKKPNLIISTCGISLATNITRLTSNSYSEGFSPIRYTNEKDKPKNKDLEKLIAKIGDNFLSSDISQQKKQSAELNALWCFYKDQPKQHSEDLHYLIHTDTWLGQEVAQKIKEAMEANQLKIQLKKINELRTSSLEGFRNGISDLINFLEEILPASQDSYNIIFNLSGGFKSIQGVMQNLASIYADEVIYIFENSETLLTIPKLPMKLDEQVIEVYLSELRRLSLGLPLSSEKINLLPQVFLYRLDDEAELSEWGSLIFERSKKDLYPKKLWSSPSKKIKYGENFEKSLQKLEADRFKHINERIDDLTRFAETETNLKRLDFKPLKGKTNISTHECDAWADQDAKRIFCHYEHDIIVLDSLDKALH